MKIIMPRWRIAALSGRRAAGIAIVGLLSATLARAQDQGGLQAVIDLSFGGRLKTSSPGTTDNAATSKIGFRLSSETRSQKLDFGLTGNLSDGSKDGFVVRPLADLAYQRSSRSSELDVSASYRQEKIDSATLIQDFTGAELVATSGVRRSSVVSFGLVTGKDAPFGTNTQFNYSQRRFTGTNDPNLNDEDRWRLSSTLSFAVSSTVSLRLDGSYSERHTLGSTDYVEQSRRLGVGADIRVNPVWTVSTDVRGVNIETRQNDGFGNRISSTENGTEYGVSGTRAMHNGTFTLSANRSISAAGGQTSVNVGRAFEQRSGSFDASLGVVRFDTGGDFGLLAALGYTRAMAGGAELAVNLNQTADTNSDNQNILRSQVQARFTQPLTAVSNWSISTSLARVLVAGGGSDQSLAQIGLSYSHALTRDWDLQLGVDHRRRYNNGAEVSHTNMLTASIGRSFTFRP